MPPTLTTSLQVLSGCVASVITLAIAISAPLLRVGGVYDLRLFPRADDLEYDTSHTHRASQVSHCFALAFFAVSLLVSVGALSVFAKGPAVQQRRIATALAVFAALGACFHLIALATLVKLAVHWKNKLDHLPIPMPDLRVDYRVGLYADFLGFIVTFGTSVMAIVAATRFRRGNYVQLE